MKIEFIDLAAQQKRIKPEIDAGIQKVLAHGQYIMGPEVAELEQKLAQYVGAKHALTIASGTDALLIAMMALGVGAGDEVVTTPFTFMATGEMIALLGAKPVFVDIDPRTYNIDPAQIEKAITPRTKAIVPVSLYGQCADFDAINQIARRHGVPVIEDSAQSFGGSYRGLRSGSGKLSAVSCTSFFPSKPLGCYGDGGACFTDDDGLAAAINEIRLHGQSRRYYHTRIGVNGRFDTIQAAILLPKLRIFPEEVGLREQAGARYTRLIQERLGAKAVTPYVAPYGTSPFAQYTIQVEQRDVVQANLQKQGVPTAVHYPVPLNLQPVFKYLGQPEGSFPVAEAVAKRVLSLPMHPYITEEQQRHVVGALAEAIVS